MVDVTNIVGIARELKGVHTALAQAARLTEAHSRGRQVNLQVVDSGLLSGYVLEGRTDKKTIKTLDADLSLLGQETFELYSRFANDSPFKIVLSLPTVYEFANSLMRISGRLIRDSDSLLKNAKLYDRAMRFIEEEVVAGNLRDNAALYAFIKDIVGLLPPETGYHNAKNLAELVRSRAIVGLGEYYTRDDYQKARDTILRNKDRLFHSFNEGRRRKDGEPLDAFRFRNLIDACNFSISSGLNSVRSDIELSVAAPAPSLPRQREVQQLLDERTLPSALCLALKARAIAGDSPKQNEEISGWLESFSDRVQICLKYLSGINQASDLTDNRKREIFMLYEDYMRPSFGRGRTGLTDAETLARARELFTSPTAFRDRLSEAGRAIEDAAATAFEVTPVLTSEEVIADLGLSDSPQMKGITQRFTKK